MRPLSNKVIFTVKSAAMSYFSVQKTLIASAVGLCIVFLSGCAATGVNYRPVVDGSDLAHYETDLADCQREAERDIAARGETQSDAILGAMLGALAGITEGTEEAIAGAAIGALVGGGIGQHAENKASREKVISCMRSRGYNVVEAED